MQSILPDALMVHFHPTMQHGAEGHLISTGLAHQCQSFNHLLLVSSELGCLITLMTSIVPGLLPKKAKCLLDH
jgi:hypothetical protein